MKLALMAGLGAALSLFTACVVNETECDAECRELWMDGPRHNDTGSLDTLVSRFYRPPANSADSARPVIIAIHGYTASTFEWREFRVWAESAQGGGDSLRVSSVLLGGHGRDLEDFRKSKWEDWGRPILEEYDTLAALGYRNISFAASSTGAALLMQHLSTGKFRDRPPRWVFLIDPIVVPSAKLLTLVNLVGPILGNSPNKGTDEENTHWYVNRPAETLAQLYELINLVKNRLEEGFKLPLATQAKVYKGTHDKLADPVGALLIYKGMRESNGDRVAVDMLDTRKHVFTRLKGRNLGTAADSARAVDLQTAVFQDMRSKVLGR